MGASTYAGLREEFGISQEVAMWVPSSPPACHACCCRSSRTPADPFSPRLVRSLNVSLYVLGLACVLSRDAAIPVPILTCRPLLEASARSSWRLCRSSLAGQRSTTSA